jgi:8-oxo-dGTP pyrophosphatase MutT (NUDIX family)
MGGILLDSSMERVLLVKGWKSTGCWGFPRGKINQNETDMECAVREVLEETGVDLEGHMREEDTIEVFMDGKRNKLYIVAGVDPDSTEFAPKCRGVSSQASKCSTSRDA